MIWLDAKKVRPQLRQTVLVFTQGYGQSGNYWCDYEIATYIKAPHDRRRCVFAKTLDVEVREHSPWIYTGVTHWMPLPEPPEQIERPR